MLPATVIALESGNHVTAVRSEEKDGYTAVQVGMCVRESVFESWGGGLVGAR